MKKFILSVFDYFKMLFYQSKKLLITMSKPDEKSFILLAKIVFIMILAVGLLGFIIEIIMSSDALLIRLFRK